ncbi:leucine-rich_repeat domain-containing protein [Hexamita inflata]|uniref:Leucine-rich repeat domain-containing protein n=1 Tax=Hexamita inflata TaxID=28002 RepID=A0AA86P889_9EUKA|nr:leucine-rich repeat domain-containing protein [Hexamita inflata]
MSGQQCEQDNTRIIKLFQNKIKNGKLYINNQDQRVRAYKIQSLEILQNFKIQRLELHHCPDLILKLQNKMLKELEMKDCKIQSIDELYLENLELLHIEEYHQENDYVFDQQKGFVIIDSPQLMLNISHLRKCNKLKTLHLIGYKDIDIDPLKLLTGLIRLNLSDCGLKNINQLRSLINIQELCLSQNNNIDLASIQYLTSLVKLDVRQCNITNVEGVLELTNLKELIMEYNIGVDISPLTHLTSLSTLNLSHCWLENLSVLTPLINLISLNVSSNEIIDLSPLQFMKQLKQLNCQSNEILNIDVLRSLTSLEELNISMNPIIYLAPLKEIKLNKLEAYIMYQIQDYPELKNKESNQARFEMELSEEEIQLINTIRDLNAPIIKLKQITEQRQNFIVQINIQKQNAIEQLKLQYYNQTVFTQKIVQLFQQSINQENYN